MLYFCIRASKGLEVPISLLVLMKENLEEAKAIKEKPEIIQALHSDNDSYPIWPFDRSILLKFLAPQIVSVLSLLIQLGPIVDALKSIFRSS